MPRGGNGSAIYAYAANYKSPHRETIMCSNSTRRASGLSPSLVLNEDGVTIKKLRAARKAERGISIADCPGHLVNDIPFHAKLVSQ